MHILWLKESWSRDNSMSPPHDVGIICPMRVRDLLMAYYCAVCVMSKHARLKQLQQPSLFLDPFLYSQLSVLFRSRTNQYKIFSGISSNKWSLHTDNDKQQTVFLYYIIKLTALSYSHIFTSCLR